MYTISCPNLSDDALLYGEFALFLSIVRGYPYPRLRNAFFIWGICVIRGVGGRGCNKYHPMNITFFDVPKGVAHLRVQNVQLLSVFEHHSASSQGSHQVSHHSHRAFISKYASFTAESQGPFPLFTFFRARARPLYASYFTYSAPHFAAAVLFCCIFSPQFVICCANRAAARPFRTPLRGGSPSATVHLLRRCTRASPSGGGLAAPLAPCEFIRFFLRALLKKCPKQVLASLAMSLKSAPFGGF